LGGTNGNYGELALTRFDLLSLKVIRKSRSRHCLLPFGDGVASIFALAALSRSSEDYTVVRKISLALVFMAMAGAASASGSDKGKGFDHDTCFHFLWLSFGCDPVERPTPPVKAPEIDPASAIAGFTMLVGGLAVLRGRRRINSKE
jgi:hypothetical protein